MKILLVEDEKITRKTLTDFIQKEGHDVISTGDGLEAAAYLSKEYPDIVITDLQLPGMNGLDILKLAKERNSQASVIMMTAYATVETAVEALKHGAYDYLTKPFNPDRLLSMIHHIQKLKDIIDENQKLKDRLQLFENKTIIGNSEPIKQLLETIRMIARHDSTILIEGESGTGKEVCARAIHESSQRSGAGFIAVNCAAIPETLIESELFGHEKGAFTGAAKRHIGYFERAEKGTLFIDDIDDLPLAVQVKLLRVLQEKELVRVGGSETIPIDVRIICATKVNLRERVNERLFREDLFYRLNIVPIKLPPLRERKGDIPLLTEHFFIKHRAADKIRLLNNQIYQRMMGYDWNGNVRELENFVERIIALSEPGALNANILDTLPSPAAAAPVIMRLEDEYPPYEVYMLDKEKEILDWALRKSENNLTNAAKILQIPRTTLRSKLDKIYKTETADSTDSFAGNNING